MVNPALVLTVINLATATTTNSPIDTPTKSPIASNGNAYQNYNGVVGNLLITRRGNYTHLPDCDDQMDYCEFVMDPPNRAMHILRNPTLARCDPIIFMHNYEYLGTPVMKIIVYNR